MFAPHIIPVHWGDMGGWRDKDVIQRFGQYTTPRFVKVITTDFTVPHLDELPTDAILLIRNHPLSEDGPRNMSTALASGFETALPSRYLGMAAAMVQAANMGYMPKDDDLAGQMGHANSLVRGLDSKTAALTWAVDPVALGQKHATQYKQTADWLVARGVPKSRQLYEGLNEPNLWATEPPAWTAAYYRAFTLAMHNLGLHVCVGNFGVGWPGNDGIKDGPVLWAFWKPVIDVMTAGDYLGLHEYWALHSCKENWKWWAGRFLQCPYNVPILITECGIDTGVMGQWYGAWRDLPANNYDEKAALYVTELLEYATLCLADARVRALFIFTYDIGSNHWEKFDVRDSVFLPELFRRDFAVRGPGKPIPALPGSPPVLPPVVIPPTPEPPPEPPVVPPVVVPPPITTSIEYGFSVHDYAFQPSGTWFDGIVTKDGQPFNGARVVFAWDPDGEWATQPAVSGPHTGYADWAPGYYSHIVSTGCPAQQHIWSAWLVGNGGTKRISPIAALEFDGPGGDNQCKLDWTLRTVSSVPEPVPTLRSLLLKAAAEKQVLELNPGAALQKAVAADNKILAGSDTFCPTSEEWPVSFGGKDYVAQRYEALGSGEVRVYYCELGQWSNVLHEVR